MSKFTRVLRYGHQQNARPVSIVLVVAILSLVKSHRCCRSPTEADVSVCQVKYLKIGIFCTYPSSFKGFSAGSVILFGLCKEFLRHAGDRDDATSTVIEVFCAPETREQPTRHFTAKRKREEQDRAQQHHHLTMDSAACQKLVEEAWSTHVLKTLEEYIRIPNLSPSFDAEVGLLHEQGPPLKALPCAKHMLVMLMVLRLLPPPYLCPVGAHQWSAGEGRRPSGRLGKGARGKEVKRRVWSGAPRVCMEWGAVCVGGGGPRVCVWGGAAWEGRVERGVGGGRGAAWGRGSGGGGCEGGDGVGRC